jgi:phage recombination protein Bet
MTELPVNGSGIRPKSVILDMADHYGMDPTRFEQTLRATIFPMNGSAEQFATFLLACKAHDLNPFLREIYPMVDRRSGRVASIVSIDGWVTLVNRQPAFDGMTFDSIHDSDGRLIAVTCSMFRKDRAHPVVVTEYLAECWRDTEAWKMSHRMLRHRAMIQCARYAFGLGGITDDDEAERWVNRQSPSSGSATPYAPAPHHVFPPEPQPVPPRPKPVPPPPPPPPPPPGHPGRGDARPDDPGGISADPGAKLARFEEALAAAETVADCDRAFIDIIEPMIKAGVLTREEEEEAEARMVERCGPLMEI